MFRANITTAVVLVLTACANGPDVGELRSEMTQVGDTVTVTTRGEPVRTRADSVDVVWQSPELENPGAMIAVDGALVVADRARLSYLSTAGEYLGSVRVTPASPWVNVEGPTLARLNGGMVGLWSELVHTDRPTRTALVWHDLAADTPTVLAWWDGEQYADDGPMFAPVQLFGPRVITALGTDGRLAVGDGMVYCVRIHHLRKNGVLKACRVRERIPFGDGIRNPGLASWRTSVERKP